MPLQLIAPIEQEFSLDVSDELFGNDGEPTKVTIRQAKQGAIERRSFIYSEVTNIIAPTAELSAEMQLRQKWSLEELKRVEVYLTLTNCNIKDVDGHPLFRFKTENEQHVLDMSDPVFKFAWAKLDGPIASEIHAKVLEVNPDWAGPLGR